jgi:hypothetical protein
MVHGTQKLFGVPAPFPVPHLPLLFLAGGMIETFGGLLTDWILHSTRRLYPFRRDGCSLLQVPCTAGILAATERCRRRGALLLYLPTISRERGRSVEP